jgi:hypothetical protein
MGTTQKSRSIWIASLALTAACSRAPKLAGESFVTLRVPIDREVPERGSFELRAECGAPFDPAKPSVILIADGQQFYLRPGAIATLQQELFSNELNVVGLIGRGDSPACQAAATRPDGAVDWTAAWQIFQWSEWIEDLEALRRVLVGPHRSLLLYGRSGGAYLTHQYLERYGQFVTCAATQAADNPFLAHELGLTEDRFWEEPATIDPQLQPLLGVDLGWQDSVHLAVDQVPTLKASALRYRIRFVGKTLNRRCLELIADSGQTPLLRTHAAEIETLRRLASGTVVLQSAVDVLGALVIDCDVIEVSQRQVWSRESGAPLGRHRTPCVTRRRQEQNLTAPTH